MSVPWVPLFQRPCYIWDFIASLPLYRFLINICWARKTPHASTWIHYIREYSRHTENEMEPVDIVFMTTTSMHFLCYISTLCTYQSFIFARTLWLMAQMTRVLRKRHSSNFTIHWSDLLHVFATVSNLINGLRSGSGRFDPLSVELCTKTIWHKFCICPNPGQQWCAIGFGNALTRILACRHQQNHAVCHINHVSSTDPFPYFVSLHEQWCSGVCLICETLFWMHLAHAITQRRLDI